MIQINEIKMFPKVEVLLELAQFLALLLLYRVAVSSEQELGLLELAQFLETALRGHEVSLVALMGGSQLYFRRCYLALNKS